MISGEKVWLTRLRAWLARRRDANDGELEDWLRRSGKRLHSGRAASRQKIRDKYHERLAW